MPASIEVGLYRIAVEALDNVLSHASASRLSVIVLLRKLSLMLLIEDDGCGFDYASVSSDIPRSRGLFTMEERATALGGILQIESRPNEGTTVRVEINITARTGPNTGQ
jgi:two-component system, NarL family, sensor histidine kinase UhpB